MPHSRIKATEFDRSSSVLFFHWRFYAIPQIVYPTYQSFVGGTGKNTFLQRKLSRIKLWLLGRQEEIWEYVF